MKKNHVTQKTHLKRSKTNDFRCINGGCNGKNIEITDELFDEDISDDATLAVAFECQDCKHRWREEFVMLRYVTEHCPCEKAAAA